ncbi:cell division cycle-associated protein 4 [Latimeria chalumnae]|uniref:Cell division cycle associated 4 n=1 Tax=Latimeria chalumnae TaxID=7897 RepID=H3ARQ6_LATCH|nr:PREDICTED: cell division cycle-associated protein 4 [Latimeria chalumnae]XP_005986434.1 PREDICTED: cell division cycle-associated protein 4 [Latimeria chalumnae]|eukprot:XP_005986433.1 PREDICTED: cell division cycle-associated protein 4 [Latimeria chalumnae]
MFTKSTKRKYLDGEEVIERSLAGHKAVASYNLQRQSLLDMSLIKLQLCQMLVEPNLCRSVLIANTVRLIQEEMIQDGSWQMLNTLTTAHSVDRLVSTDILCRPSPKEQDEDSVTASTYVNFKDHVGVQSQDIISLPSKVFSLQLQGNMRSNPKIWELDDQATVQAELPKSLEQIFGAADLKNSSDSAVEELLVGTDTPYYDLDTVLTGVLGNQKVGQYDLTDSLSSATATSVNSSSNCKMDLNELDHIMEIIVGS